MLRAARRLHNLRERIVAHSPPPEQRPPPTRFLQGRRPLAWASVGRPLEARARWVPVVSALSEAGMTGCGFERAELVSSPSEHYTCTRRWTAHHLQSSAAGQTSAGMIWQSRQMELAAVHAKPPLQVLMTSVEQATRTVVVYDTAGEGDRRFDASIEYADLGQGAGLEMVTGLCAEMGLYARPQTAVGCCAAGARRVASATRDRSSQSQPHRRAVCAPDPITTTRRRRTGSRSAGLAGRGRRCRRSGP